MSSFLTRSLPSRTFAVARAIPRAAAVHTPRAFTTSYPLQKTATETVKDGLKTVDKVVSEKLVDGIDLASKSFFHLKPIALPLLYEAAAAH